MKSLFVTALIIDYDDTLATSGKSAYFKHLARYGYDESLLTKVYEEIRMTIGNSPRNFLYHLTNYVEVPEIEKRIKETEQVYMEGSILFPDSIPCVERWRSQGIPVHILSYGERTFQPRKVERARIPNDGLHVVDHTGEKHEIINRLLARYGPKIAHINDKAKEHDKISQYCNPSDLYEIWIRRPDMDSPYDKEGARSYIDISSFKDIDFKLPK